MGSSLARAFSQARTAVDFDVTITAIYVFAGAEFISVSSLPLSMVGLRSSIFLAFRTKSAYDRWWEARTLWGGLSNTSRTLARQALTLMQAGPSRDLEPAQSAVDPVADLLCACAPLSPAQAEPYPELRSRLDRETLDSLRMHKNVPFGPFAVQWGICFGRPFSGSGWTPTDGRRLTEH